MRIIIMTLIMLLFCLSCLAMTKEEAAEVGIGDTVFLDFTKFNTTVKSITGKVVDKAPDGEWFAVYQLFPDGSWSFNRWNKYFITSVITKAPSIVIPPNVAELQTQLKQKDDLIAKLRAIISQLISSYNAMTFY